MNSNMLLTATAFACGLGLTGAAHAAASVSTTVTNIRYTLIDLDINDGITPGVLFGATTIPSDANVGLVLPGNVVVQDQHYGSTGNAPVSAALATPPLAGFASIGGDGSLVGMSLTNGVIVGSDYSQSFQYGASTYTGRQLVGVTANTGITWYADVTFVGTESGVTAGLSAQEIHGSASMVLYFNRDNVVAPSLTFSSGTDNPAPYVTGTTQTLSYSYANLTNNYLNAFISFGASAGGSQVVSAVPEPATYGMLGIGLGIISLLARRRNR